MGVSALARQAALRPELDAVQLRIQRPAARHPDPVLLRAREPVPRPLQPAADPAARRLGADRAGAAGEVVAELVPVPAVRVPRPVPPRLHRPASRCASSLRSSDRAGAVRRSGEARCTSRGASCARSGRARRGPTTSRGCSRCSHPGRTRSGSSSPTTTAVTPSGVARLVQAQLAGTDDADDSALARRRAAARHRQARRQPRRLRAGRGHRVGRRRRPRPRRRVVGDGAGSPGASASTCATPSSGADRIRLAGGPEEAARWAAAHHDAATWDRLDIPDAGRRRPRRRRQRLTPRFIVRVHLR